MGRESRPMPFSLLPEIPDSMWNYWWLGERNAGIFAALQARAGEHISASLFRQVGAKRAGAVAVPCKDMTYHATKWVCQTPTVLCLAPPLQGTTSSHAWTQTRQEMLVRGGDGMKPTRREWERC